MGSLDATAVHQSCGGTANQTIRDGGTDACDHLATHRRSGRSIGSGYAYGQTANFEGTFAAESDHRRHHRRQRLPRRHLRRAPRRARAIQRRATRTTAAGSASFPDTNPRVRWEHALAQTIAPTGHEHRVRTIYGWNYNGLPASTVLHWFPQLSTAGPTPGSTRPAWSLAGNSNYVVMGGEFPRVNGVAQQGLVRMAVSSLAPNKQGPTLHHSARIDAVPATTAILARPRARLRSGSGQHGTTTTKP